MTLEDIITVAARYLEKDRSQVVFDTIDLGLVAINQVRRDAEQTNDFNFTRRLLTLSVDGVTGGSLDEATEYGSQLVTTYDIKTIVDVGIVGRDSNFRPVEWTSSSDSLNRYRQDNMFSVVRFPTDAQAITGPLGQRRFVFAGNKVFLFPKAPNVTITLGIDAYTFSPDWTDSDTDGCGIDSPWLRHGSMYLQWGTVVNLNQLFKGFVFRQEGNLAPPEKLMQQGLENMIRWDSFQSEQFRRHSR